jgi:hypothetical protein
LEPIRLVSFIQELQVIKRLYYKGGRILAALTDQIEEENLYGKDPNIEIETV